MKDSVVPGSVFELADVAQLVRVVACDGHVVMYDNWCPDKRGWGMARLTGRYSYYRLPREYFERHVRYLHTDALSQSEVDVHRPDLPFSLAQHDDLSWYESWATDKPLPDFHDLDGRNVDAPAVYLVPFGPKDGGKPAVLVKAGNGRNFSETELLLCAHEIQRAHNGEKRLTAGVGLHRQGVQGKLPSYYLWGSRSRLESRTQHAV